MANAIVTIGTTLARGTGTGSPETFETVRGVQDLSGPDTTRTEIDTTDITDTDQTFVLGLRTNGQVSFSMNYVPSDTVHAGLATDYSDGTLRNFKLTFVDTTEVEFAAYVQGFSYSVSKDSTLMRDVVLRISGAVTETPFSP